MDFMSKGGVIVKKKVVEGEERKKECSLLP